MSRRPDWETDGADWPNRRFSRFVDADGLRWHVQLMGEGPCVLLLHGTGAATHSWRALAPLLAERFSIVAPDLPSHGFTSPPRRRSDLSMSRIAEATAALLAALDIAPEAIVGHSAGAAIAVRMCLDGLAAPRTIVSINGALLPFGGPFAQWASGLARLLAYNPLTLHYFASRAAAPGAISRLIGGTGSRIDAQGIAYYERLMRRTAHLEGAVGLMAHWDLDALKRDLPRLEAPLALIVGDRDRAVAPSDAQRIARLAPNAQVAIASGLGHLAHEEAPELIAEMIFDALQPLLNG